MSERMCTCAVHCTRSGYHERACCDAPLCDCWCHDRRRVPDPPSAKPIVEAILLGVLFAALLFGHA